MKEETTGRAAVLHRPGELKIELVQTPSVGPTEVLVQVKYVSLCGSDFKLFQGSHPNQPEGPLIPGHEWAGRVIRAGELVVGLSPGDWVTGDCSLYCGRCKMCSVNKNLCDHGQKFGITCDGALRQWLVIPAGYLYKIPEGLPVSLASVTEPFAVAIEAVSDLNVRDKKAIVTGGGIIGLAAALVLHSKGARVNLVEVSPDRRVLLRQALGERTLVSGANPGGHYHVAVEASGQPECVAGLYNVLVPAGDLILLGHVTAPVSIKEIVKKALRVRGSIGGTGSFPQAMDILSREKDNIQKALRFFTFEDIGPVLSSGNYAVKSALKAIIKIGGDNDVET
ncbi:MAG: zinc-dependent alcohol dehydrogenase [Bacillota bacterium]